MWLVSHRLPTADLESRSTWFNNAMPYNTRRNSIPYCAIKYNTLQLSAIQLQFNAIRCYAIKCSLVQCSAMQYEKIRCNTAQLHTTHHLEYELSAESMLRVFLLFFFFSEKRILIFLHQLCSELGHGKAVLYIVL